MRGRSAHATVVIALAVASVAACANHASTPTGAADVPKYAVYEGGVAGVGDSALLAGKVVIKQGCLTVEDAETQTEYVPVFPSTTSDATRMRAGDEVELRGGSHDSVPEGTTLPHGCGTVGPFWVVVEEPG